MEKELQVLIAEDNPGDAFLIEAALIEHGLRYTLRSFSNGGQAATFLATVIFETDSHCPDIALLDLNLPKVEGHELLRMIRRHPVCSNIPVVIVTSSDSPRDRDAAAQHGASYYFRKPSSLDDFLKLGAVVKELTGGGSSTMKFHS